MSNPSSSSAASSDASGASSSTSDSMVDVPAADASSPPTTNAASASSSSSSSSSSASASSSEAGRSNSPKRQRTRDAADSSSSASSTSSKSSSTSAAAAAAAAASMTPAQREDIRINMLRYIKQLTVGCGIAGCRNMTHCVTAGAAAVQRPEALQRAQQLYRNHVASCVPDPRTSAPLAATASPALAPHPQAAAAATPVTPASASSAISATPASSIAPVVAPAAAVVAASPSAPASSFSTPVRPAAAAASSASGSASGAASSTPRTSPVLAPAAATSSSSSSSASSIPSPSSSPRSSPSLAAMLASSTPLVPRLEAPAFPPIDNVAAWCAELEQKKAEWVSRGSNPEDRQPFRALMTRIYGVFDDFKSLNASFRVHKTEEDRAREREAIDKENSMSDAPPASAEAVVVVASAAAASPATPAGTSSAASRAAALEAKLASPLVAADQFQPGLDYDQLEAFYASVTDLCFTDKDGNENRPLLTSMLNGMRRGMLNFTPMAAHHVHPQLLRVVPILLCNTTMWFDPSHYELLTLLLTRVVAPLPRPAKKLLVSWFCDVERWAPGVPKVLTALQKSRMFSMEKFENLLGALQQYISVRVFDKNDLREVAPAVVAISLLHEANEKFGQWYRAIPSSIPRAAKFPLQLQPQLFYNDAINSQADLKVEFNRWMRARMQGGLKESDFSFSRYNFILDAGSKSSLLKYDSMVQMQNQYRDTVIANGMNERAGYLVLEVRRSNLIPDTLRALANKGPKDYKLPLKIHFSGEKGIDAGGLRKEFFQLIVAQLFDVSYGMFLLDDETRTFRFNPDSLDSPMEFELIGAVLGIAIYNSTIIDMHLPRVIYKQLLNQKPDLDDLLEAQPSLAKGLIQLLEFDGDVESTFSRDFTLSYDSWGVSKTVELKAGGASIPVTNANREEFIALYVEWVLEKSIAKQFAAFAKGFHRACGGEALKLFRPFELELLVCGAQEFDFDALESTTRYEDGYTKESQVCRWFWEIVHEELTLDEKKRLLEFCTGSDRVPIRGLASMFLTISKQGPDSPQLPTSHTCFNHMLLPEYSSKDKLRTLLKLALQNSKGFGLI